MSTACENFILKITSNCNLNCSYCYMFNMGDTSFRNKPKVMTKQTAISSLQRIYEYSIKNNTEEVNIILHGGEPLLCGKEWLVWFIKKSEELKPSSLKVIYSIQTNGTLLDEEWLNIISSYRIELGISLDGLPEAHNSYRVDHRGQGSYDKVLRGLNLVQSSGYLNWGVLIVANPEYSGEEIYRHLVNIGVKNMDFLWPDYNHDVPPNKKEYSLESYFISIFNTWYNEKNPDISVRWFVNVIRMLLSGTSQIDALGPVPLNEVVIETDGSLEPLDVLRTCKDSFTRLGLNVLENSIEDLIQTELYQTCVNNQEILPAKCKNCSIYNFCGGGYMPHRWSSEKEFSNPSIHCNDLYNIITYIYNQVVEDLLASKAEFKIG